ncbi:MAG: hypothetical protein JXR52_01620 [Bacteroidales bacterium]|nr:hypothetical protein [Bacteroidales bacterium]
MKIKPILFFLCLGFMIVSRSNSQSIVTVTEEADQFLLSSEALHLKIKKDPWHISVYDTKGNFISGEKSGEVFLFGTDRIRGCESGDYIEMGYDTLVKRDPHFYHLYDESVIIGESVVFECFTESGKAAQVYVTFRNPFVFSVWMTVPDVVQPVRHRFVSDEGEHFFGLGECWDARSLDLKGLSITMNNSSGTPDQGGYIPFYVSTEGYGILVDNNLKVNFNFTESDEVFITAPAISGSEDGAGYFYGSSLLYYFYYGPGLLDVLDRFTEHVSRPALPPSWALFSTWQWRDTNDEANVYKDAAGMRDEGIPCGLIWIDRPWAQGSENMPPPFEWQTSRYPNGSTMFGDLQDGGYKTGVWVARNLYGSFADSMNYKQLKLDTRPFIERDNCQMYKIDRGNVQSIDPLFTCQAYYEAWDDVLHGDFVTLPRTIANRAQQYVSGKWPGDNDNTYDYPSGLKANIAAMLNLAIAGFPFWGSDTGGFPDPPGNNVTIRWAQFSSFCTIFETAGTPYNYSGTYRDLYRKYAELYTRMFPYRWTYARMAHEKGHPVTRALPLVFPQDETGYGEKFEYLYGDWILVAPVVDATFSRDVYLPEGTWYDWWDGMPYEGPMTINGYPAPEDKLPLFIKAGAIIPMIDVQQTWLDASMDPITLRMYPEGESEFTILGDTIIYEGLEKPYTGLKTTNVKCSKTVGEIRIVTGEVTGSLIYELHPGGIPLSVEKNETALQQFNSRSEWETAHEGWYYEAGNGSIAWIKTAGGEPRADTLLVFYEDFVATESFIGFSSFEIVPNPVGEKGKIVINLTRNAMVQIDVVDILGRQAVRMPDESHAPGRHEIDLPVDGLYSGLYLVTCRVNGSCGTELMVVR